MWLLEEPLPIFFLGILVEALLFGTLIHTGRRSVFVAMAAVLVLLLGLLAAEQFVVTDVESVEKNDQNGLYYQVYHVKTGLYKTRRSVFWSDLLLCLLSCIFELRRS